MSDTAVNCELSIVLGAYNMAREIPRTLHSLTRGYQQGVADLNYEVIVADNGSTLPLGIPPATAMGCAVKYLKFPPGNASPVKALNEAMRQAAGAWVGLMIDGARILSPGVLRYAMAAARLHPLPVICTHGFHLGPDLQPRSVAKGYSQEREDELLASVNWMEDGYRLLEVSVLAGSSYRGWFINPTESNCLIMRREMWERLGYLDERFLTPGGGLVNLDIFKRACEMPGAQLITLLGEGSFHQVHGGAATGQVKPAENPNAAFDREYQQIRGEVYRVPTYPCMFVGTLHRAAEKHVVLSAQRLQR